jgi:5-methylcytosine-specific restriction endonuclease McrA
MKVYCKNCKKEFSRFPSQIKNGEGKFCSKACYTQAMQGIDIFALRGVKKAQRKRIRVEINCRICNKRFEIIPSQLGLRAYCSKGCYLSEHKAKVIDVEYLRESPKYKSWRIKVFQRDGFTCQSCGKVGNGIQAHHIISVVKDVKRIFDINNGITLCIECHKLIHKSNKPKRKQGELLENLNEIISNQAKQECLEGSETTVYGQDLTMKPHECPAPKGDDIVRANRRLLEAVDK